MSDEDPKREANTPVPEEELLQERAKEVRPTATARVGAEAVARQEA